MDLKPVYKATFLAFVLGTYLVHHSINLFADLKERLMRYALRYYRLSSQ